MYNLHKYKVHYLSISILCSYTLLLHYISESKYCLFLQHYTCLTYLVTSYFCNYLPVHLSPDVLTLHVGEKQTHTGTRESLLSDN